MSKINGDKARKNVNDKRSAKTREKMRELRARLNAQAKKSK